MLDSKKIIILLLFLIKTISSANILYVSPVTSISHHMWNKVIVMSLLERGHNITMLTHETEETPLPKNFTLITMEGIYEMMAQVYDVQVFTERGILRSMTETYDYSAWACQYDYNTTGFETLLNYPEDHTFDMIIFDNSLGSSCYYTLIKKFHNPPVVVVSPLLLPPALSLAFGNHLYPSYEPYYGTTFANKMSFAERILNFVYTYADILYRNYVRFFNEDAIVERRFGKQKLSLAQLERKVSLLLCNVDPVFDYPVALPPNIIHVGGLHARPSQPLPKDLQKIMDQAKHGVILFSLGTTMRSDRLDLKSRQALLKVFSKLSQIVVWKFESDEIEGLPENVVIRKWLPQNDMLGHPNIKLFISHGGALSTQEAIYHGVPIIGIPFVCDQHVNIRKVEERKIGKMLDRKNLTVDNIYEALDEVLNTDVYYTNMRDSSKRYYDQVQVALERGIFWIEYLLRHGSAEHLILPARDMESYQTANLDVLLVLLLTVIVIYSTLMFFVACCKFFPF